MTPQVATQPDPQVVSEQRRRALVDRSCRQTVLLYYASAVFWLLAGSVAALLASIKLHYPEFLGNTEWLTFGRVRPAHLNSMIYGWASMSGIGTSLWLQARLCRVRLPFRVLLPITAVVWNLAIAAGTISILAGQFTSVEWLEFPAQVYPFLAFVLIVLLVASVRMFRARRTAHTYVSQWYLFGSVIWFPLLYTAGVFMDQLEIVRGVAKGTLNWWFAHNVLGLWLTPIGLASVYYFIPKVIGKPIHSYHLSLFGFWTLALFYNWAGTHHLVGGPLPAWVITLGIVGSVLMFIPVITVAINHHLTMVGNFHALKVSPTLRFVVFGAVSYTVVSFQGSLHSLRSLSEITHFTHYTIAHSHLGVYSFATMVTFGSFYYIVPRLTRNEWSSATLIKWHFWLTATGMAVYFLSLSWGGWNQGRMMNDPGVPFMRIVEYLKPYLAARSLAGILMTAGHVVFAWLFWRILHTSNFSFTGPTLFTTRPPRTRTRVEPA